MKKRVTLFTLIAIVSLSGCVTTSTTVNETPTPLPLEETWMGNDLVSNNYIFDYQNPTSNYVGEVIDNSQTILDTDTRWVIELEASELQEDVGEASTGILISGSTDDGKRSAIFFVYQSGGWNLGIDSPTSSGSYSGEFFDQLTNPKQSFEITIANNKKTLEIKNQEGFEYSHTFPEPLFDNIKSVVTEFQVGPHSILKMTKLTIEQKHFVQVALHSPDTQEPVSTLVSSTTTLVSTPTLPPVVSLPVSRFDSLPVLESINIENVANLTKVGEFSDIRLKSLDVADAKNRVAVVFADANDDFLMEVRIYDLPDLSPSVVVLAESYKLSSNGNWLAVQAGGVIQIWNLNKQSKSCEIGFEGGIDPGQSIMDFSSTSNYFMFNGMVRNSTNTYQSQYINLNNCQKIYGEKSKTPLVISFSPDGHYLAYVRGDQVILFKIDDKKGDKFGEIGNVRGLGFMPDSKSLIVSYSNNTKIYKLADESVINQVESNVGRDNAFLYTLEDGQYVLIAGRNNNLMWSIVDNKVLSVGNTIILGNQDFF